MKGVSLGFCCAFYSLAVSERAVVSTLSIYFLPDTVLSNQHVFTHLIPVTTLGGSIYYYAHFTEEETEEERLNNLSKIIQFNL